MKQQPPAITRRRWCRGGLRRQIGIAQRWRWSRLRQSFGRRLYISLSLSMRMNAAAGRFQAATDPKADRNPDAMLASAAKEVA